MGDAARRAAIYQGLMRRNRRVRVLRLAVPLAGALVLTALLGEIYLSSLGTRFGVRESHGQTLLSVFAGAVEVRCEFCGREYHFPLTEFGILFHGAQGAVPAPERLQ